MVRIERNYKTPCVLSVIFDRTPEDKVAFDAINATVEIGEWVNEGGKGFGRKHLKIVDVGITMRYIIWEFKPN